MSETAKPCRRNGGLARRRKRMQDRHLRPETGRDRQFPRATPPRPPQLHFWHRHVTHGLSLRDDEEV